MGHWSNTRSDPQRSCPNRPDEFCDSTRPNPTIRELPIYGHAIMLATKSIFQQLEAYIMQTRASSSKITNCFNPRVASGGGGNLPGGNLPPDPVFSPLHQNCFKFFGTLPWLFLDIYWLQNSERNFLISVDTVPQFLVGNRGAPKNGEKWFQA